MKTFRQIVAEAMEATFTPLGELAFYSDELALAIDRGLKLEGIHLHDAERCVRPGGPKPDEIGRPMTDEELATVGFYR